MTHNSQLADPMNPIVKAMKTLSTKKNKQDEELYILSQLQLLGGIYPEHDLTYSDDYGFNMTSKEVELTGLLTLMSC
jgi:hypothetical protein